MNRKRITAISLCLLVLLFSYTSADKLLNLDRFTTSMYNQPIPHWLAYALARLIPVAEILTAVSLLFPATQRLGLLSSFILLSTFTLYITFILLHFFRKIPCSCAGIFRHITWQQHLWINLLMLALTVLALSTASQKPLRSPLNHSI